MKIKLLLLVSLSLFTIKSNGQNRSNCLVAQYLFAGNANDNIGNNNGTVTGAALCADRHGNANNAYDFDGSGSTYIELPSANLTNNEYSYSLWVNLNSLPSVGTIAFMFDIGSTNTDQSLNIQNQYLGTPNTWGGGGYNTTTPHFGLKTTGPSLLGQWYHVLSVRATNCAKLYVNGVLVDSVGTTSTMIPNYGNGPVKAMIGKRWDNTSAINAKIDDIGIYNCALSTDQVDSIYNAQKSDCIIAQYLFAGNANDNIGNNDGTVTGAALCADRHGNANNAYDFDGTGSTYIELPSANLTNNEYSYSLWVNLNSLPSIGTIAFMFDIGSTNTDQSLNIQNQYLGTPNTWGGGGYNTTTPHFGLKTSGPSLLGQWYHILSVRATNCAKLYVNGVLVDSVGTTSTMIPNYGSGPVKAMIGKRWDNTSAINAKIDDIGIYNCALSSSKVLSIYNAQSPTGIEQLYTGSPVINVFPNPASQDVTITGITGKTTLKLYDMLGKLLIEKKVENTTTLNTSQLPVGVYMLVAEGNGIRSFNKVMISR